MDKTFRKTKPVSDTSQLKKRQLPNRAPPSYTGARFLYYLKSISLSVGNLQGNHKAFQMDVRGKPGSTEHETAYCIILK